MKPIQIKGGAQDCTHAGTRVLSPLFIHTPSFALESPMSRYSYSTESDPSDDCRLYMHLTKIKLTLSFCVSMLK
jgi:hypothetical protein